MRKLINIKTLASCIFSVLFISLVPNNLRADNNEDTSSPVTKINQVVISANRIEEEIVDIPLPVAVVDETQIEENMYTALVDLLDDTPGFSQVYEYHSPILLRGMSGSRIIILRDGNRRMSSMTSGYMGEALNVYDVGQVEIIRGPGSVMYGSGATCGIINIISRDIFENEGLKVKLAGGYSMNNEQILSLGRITYASNGFAAQLSGRYRDSTNFVYGGGEEAENSFTRDKDLSLKIGYRFQNSNQILLSAEGHFGGPWGKPYGFNQKPMMANNENENTYHTALNYTAYGSGLIDQFVINGFYDYETRDYHKRMLTVIGDVSDHTVISYLDYYGGGQAYGIIETDFHKIITGFDGYFFRIWSPESNFNYIYNSTNTKEGIAGAGISSIGAFAQDTWTLSENLNCIMGIRYDIAEIIEGDNPSEYKYLMGQSNSSVACDSFSGNAGLVYSLTESSSLSLNIGRAFRIPTADEMFNEKITCGGVVLGNPGLKPEYSWNIDAGYKGNFKQLEWDFAVFANFYHDLIVRNSCEDIEGVDETYQNTDMARITGGEFATSYNFQDLFGLGHDLKPGFSAVCYRGDDWEGNGSFWNFRETGGPLHSIPPVRIKESIRYTGYFFLFDYYFEINADHIFAKQRVPEDKLELPWSNESTEAYTLLNIMAGINFYDVAWTDNIKLKIKVKNLLDTNYYPFASYIAGKGRDFKFIISTEF